MSLKRQLESKEAHREKKRRVLTVREQAFIQAYVPLLGKARNKKFGAAMERLDQLQERTGLSDFAQLLELMDEKDRMEFFHPYPRIRDDDDEE